MFTGMNITYCLGIIDTIGETKYHNDECSSLVLGYSAENYK